MPQSPNYPFLEVLGSVSKQFYLNTYKRFDAIFPQFLKDCGKDQESLISAAKKAEKSLGWSWQIILAMGFAHAFVSQGEIPGDWKEFYLYQFPDEEGKVLPTSTIQFGIRR